MRKFVAMALVTLGFSVAGAEPPTRVLTDPWFSEKKGYYQAETTFLGMKVAYEELPFEWVRGRYYQVERRFPTGPMERAVGGMRFAPNGEGTQKAERQGRSNSGRDAR